MSSPLRVAAFLLGALCVLPGTAAELSLALDSIRHPAFEADGLSVELDAQARGEADIRIARLRVAGAEYKQLSLHCAGFYFDGRRLDCPEGTLRRDDERGKDRPPLPFSMAWRAADGSFDFALRDVDIVDLSPLVKRLRAWRPQGRLDFAVAVRKGVASLHLAVRDAAFANKTGDTAGKNIALTLDAQAQRQGKDWRWQAHLDWPQGELAIAPWHVPAGVRADAAGMLNDAELAVEQARLEAAGVGAVNASLRWDRVRDEAKAWGLVTERLDLATAMREWVQPWLASLGFPAWNTSGKAIFSAEAKDGRLTRFYAGLEDATLADGTGYLELTGVNARIPWEADRPQEAELGIVAGRLGDLPLGGFTLPLHLSGEGAQVENLSVPMLDGHLDVARLRVARTAAGWDSEFSGGIDGVSMPKLSRALGMPRMEGSVTARIPRISLAKNVLALDGALAIEVFDGGITVHRLRILDPFSAGRRFLADVTARNLDLGMLTRTFAFGSIEGRFDADLRDLEMAGWKPLRFDARIASSPGDYTRLLSLGALQDITALGDTAGGETIRRIPERSIGGFGYARIGIGCKLRDGVCLLDGLEPKGDGVLLMEGTGMPSISIIGYNRRIDWEAMVARVREMLAGKSGVVVQ